MSRLPTISELVPAWQLPSNQPFRCLGKLLPTVYSRLSVFRRVAAGLRLLCKHAKRRPACGIDHPVTAVGQQPLTSSDAFTLQAGLPSGLAARVAQCRSHPELLTVFRNSKGNTLWGQAGARGRRSRQGQGRAGAVGTPRTGTDTHLTGDVPVHVVVLPTQHRPYMEMTGEMSRKDSDA